MREPDIQDENSKNKTGRAFDAVSTHRDDNAVAETAGYVGSYGCERSRVERRKTHVKILAAGRAER